MFVRTKVYLSAVPGLNLDFQNPKLYTFFKYVTFGVVGTAESHSKLKLTLLEQGKSSGTYDEMLQ
jgi:hypothetical protein